MPKRTPPAAVPGPRPDVIVDFDCVRGLLFIVLKNIGERSAYRVATSFDRTLLGLGGQKRISELQLFKRVEFMPPGKEFRQFVDPVAICVKQNRLGKISVTITYTNREGQSFSERIVHDLRIYRDLGYTNIPASGGDDGQSS